MFSTLDVLKFKSKYSNSLHSWNIPPISVTLMVLKFWIPFISFILLHSLNIFFIVVTFSVLKLDKSKYSNCWQDWNIIYIEVTLLVLKLFSPFISFKLIQLLNISPISVTLFVTKLDKSKYSNSLHESNIPIISLIFIVLKLLSPLISFNL